MAARRCRELGVARVIEPEELTSEAVRQAALEVLHDPSYRENARRIQEETAALPGIEHAVRLLEQLARPGGTWTEGEAQPIGREQLPWISPHERPERT